MWKEEALLSLACHSGSGTGINSGVPNFRPPFILLTFCDAAFLLSLKSNNNKKKIQRRYDTSQQQKKGRDHLALLSRSPQASGREKVEKEPLWHYSLILTKHQAFFPLTRLVWIKLLAQPWRLAHVLKNWLPPSLASLKLQHFLLLLLWEVKTSVRWNLILFFRACWAYTVCHPSLTAWGVKEKKTRRQLEVFAKSILEIDP